MNKRIIISILLMLGFVPSLVHACTCGGPPSHYVIDKATTVFSGKLESFVVHKATNSGAPESGLVEFRFRVGQVWKGQPDKFVTVFSDQSSCGAYFEVGRIYFVGAYASDDDSSFLETNICSSGPFDLALEARTILDDPIIVEPELAIDRPSLEYLELAAASDDPMLAQHAKYALKALQERSKSSGEAKRAP